MTPELRVEVGLVDEVGQERLGGRPFTTARRVEPVVCAHGRPERDVVQITALAVVGEVCVVAPDGAAVEETLLAELVESDLEEGVAVWVTPASVV